MKKISKIFQKRLTFSFVNGIVFRLSISESAFFDETFLLKRQRED